MESFNNNNNNTNNNALNFNFVEYHPLKNCVTQINENTVRIPMESASA
jgi:hypothetical protein